MAIFIIECDRNGHRTTFTINYIFIIAYKLITGSRQPKDYRGIATSLKISGSVENLRTTKAQPQGVFSPTTVIIIECDSNVLRTNKNSHWTEQPQSPSKQMLRWLHTTIREQPSALLHDESKALKTLKATSKSYLAVELCSGRVHECDQEWKTHQ